MCGRGVGKAGWFCSAICFFDSNGAGDSHVGDSHVGGPRVNARRHRQRKMWTPAPSPAY
jgi:hypothetical protein